MHVLIATAGAQAGSLQRVLESFGFRVTPTRFEKLLTYCADPSAEAVDAIVLDPPSYSGGGLPGHSVATKMASLIRGLPAGAAMWDGRKWSGLPIIYVPTLAIDASDVEILASIQVDVIQSAPEQVRRYIVDRVDAYRRKLVEQFTNVGFQVIDDGGVLRVNGLTVQMRRGVDTPYYNGDADQRIGRMFVLHRDATVISHEIDEFGDLINRPNVPEEEIQAFVEAHPHFITNNLGQAIPHPYLPRPEGAHRANIPDFMIRPNVSIPRDSDYEIVDLKRADAKILAKKGHRHRFSAEVHDGIAQLRDYRNYMRDPRYAQDVAKYLGRPVKHPRLSLIIGRLPRDEEVQALDDAQAEVDVNVATYDEIMDRQINQLPRPY